MSFFFLAVPRDTRVLREIPELGVQIEELYNQGAGAELHARDGSSLARILAIETDPTEDCYLTVDPNKIVFLCNSAFLDAAKAVPNLGEVIDEVVRHTLTDPRMVRAATKEESYFFPPELPSAAAITRHIRLNEIFFGAVKGVNYSSHIAVPNFLGINYIPDRREELQHSPYQQPGNDFVN